MPAGARLKVVILLCLMLLLIQGRTAVAGLTSMADEELSSVRAAGLSFVMDNFSMRFAPSSFIELTGVEPAPCVTGDTQCQQANWQRGDARYYGVSITNGLQTSGTDWYGNGCDTSGPGGALACPIGSGNSSSLGVTGNPFGIGALASAYDPYVLRVFQYPGYDFQGNYLDGSAGNAMPTILELIGPGQTETWRWSFWGELEVGRGTTGTSAAIGACNLSDPGCSGGANFLQSQTIIRGKPVTTSGDPAILRLMQTADQDARKTLGMTYQSALSGDFRFSVRQRANSEDALHYVPDFQDSEGMYFKNVDAFLPLGTLHYQAITLDAVRDGSGNATGDFIIELTRIPNIPEIYNNFYCGIVGNPSADGCTDGSGNITSPNPDTAGYVRWGDFTGVNTATGAGLPALTDTDNGIYFIGGTSGCSAGSTCMDASVNNIGVSRLEGMRIHHLKITTLGAGE